VGYVPVLKPMFRPFDDPVVAFPLLIVVVPAAAPVAAAPPVPPVAVLAAPCARAMDEATARTEAKAIVVSFMWFFPAVVAHRETVTSKATAPASGAG
jgi:hypothetical protein